VGGVAGGGWGKRGEGWGGGTGESRGEGGREWGWREGGGGGVGGGEGEGWGGDGLGVEEGDEVGGHGNFWEKLSLRESRPRGNAAGHHRKELSKKLPPTRKWGRKRKVLGTLLKSGASLAMRRLPDETANLEGRGKNGARPFGNAALIV